MDKKIEDLNNNLDIKQNIEDILKDVDDNASIMYKINYINFVSPRISTDEIAKVLQVSKQIVEEVIKNNNKRCYFDSCAIFEPQTEVYSTGKKMR